MQRHPVTVPAALAAIALAGLLTACSAGGGAGPGGAGSAAGGAGAIVPDTARAVEQAVSGADGGQVAVPLTGAEAWVLFPNDALGATTTIVATPLKDGSGDADAVAPGFLLEEKGTGAGPKLAYPAWVVMRVPAKLGDDVSLARYTDGAWKPIPTKVTAGPDGTVLTGVATHFSPVSARKVGTKAAKKSRDGFDAFDWVIFVRGTDRIQNGPMKQTVQLTLRAVNTGGDIPGDYTGSAQIRSTNEMSGPGGSLKAVATGKSESVSIGVIQGVLAPLKPLGDGGEEPLAPLTPEADWSGGGTIKMSAMQAAGSGTIKAGGYAASAGYGNTSSVPVEVYIWGPQVSLTAKLPVGSVTFRGYIRGEGKKR